MNPTNKQLKRAGWLLLFLLLGSGVFAQTANAPKYQTTKEQSFELRAIKAEALNLQMQTQQAQQALNNKITELTDASKRIKKDNGWPDSVEFDPNNLSFCDKMVPANGGFACPTGPNPIPAPEAKKEEKK
jgi:hypothetical protein